VWVTDGLDGLSILMARMSTEHAHAVLAELGHAAKAAQTAAAATSDSWTIGEHRVHALAAAVLGGSGVLAAPANLQLEVVIDLPTLVSLSDANATGVATQRGAGPISTEAVRDLLADPDVAVTMRRLVTEPLTGHLLDYGRRTYEIPHALRDFVVARDKVCRFPGCRRRADRCQIDREDGGVSLSAVA
jgi:hypothetical protein